MPWKEKYNSTQKDYAAVWSRLDGLTFAPGEKILRKGNTRQTFLFHHQGEQVIAKYWLYKKTLKRLRSIYKPCDAVKELNLTKIAVGRGRFANLPCSYAENRQFGMLRCACLIHPLLPSSKTLLDHLQNAANESELMEGIFRFAQELGYTHDQNIYHNDYKPDNVIFDETVAPPKLHTIDWGRSKNLSPNNRKTRLEELIKSFFALKNLFKKASKERTLELLDKFLEGYEAGAEWFSKEEQLPAVKKEIIERVKKIQLKIMERAFQKYRDRKGGWSGKKHYLVMPDTDEHEVIELLNGKSETLALARFSNTADVWRAIVLLSAHHQTPRGVLGVVTERLLWKKRISLIVEKTEMPLDRKSILSQAQAILDSPQFP